MNDTRPAYEDMPQFRDTSRRSHHHYCYWCAGRWWHDDGDSECEAVSEMTCPVHDEWGADI